MVNYGYDETSKNWKEDRKELLALTLSKKLPANMGWVAGGKSPYIEVDNLYDGVRIRKITHLADEDVDLFIERADKIYSEVMA